MLKTQNDTAEFTFGTPFISSEPGKALCVYLDLPNNLNDPDSLNNKMCLLTATNIAEAQNKSVHSFDIYPNPAPAIFNVDLTLNESADVELNVFNLVGKKVSSYSKRNSAGRYNEVIDMGSEHEGV